jgi:hypothetical protein
MSFSDILFGGLAKTFAPSTKAPGWENGVGQEAGNASGIAFRQLENGSPGVLSGQTLPQVLGDAVSVNGNRVASAVMPAMMTSQAGLAQTRADLGDLRNAAAGHGPSAAALLAKAQLDDNIRAQAAAAATARGGNIQGAMRNAALAGSQMQLQTAQQIAAQRAQEQLNARQLLAQGNAAYNTATNQQQAVAAQGASAQDEADLAARALYANGLLGMASGGASGAIGVGNGLSGVAAGNTQNGWGLFNNAAKAGGSVLGGGI